MKMVPVEESVVLGELNKRSTRGKLQKDLMQFMESNHRAVELVDDLGVYKSAASMCSSYAKSARTM